MPTQPDALSEMIFDLGKWYGAWRRPEIQEWFKEQGLTVDQAKAIEDAILPLVRIFYKDR